MSEKTKNKQKRGRGWLIFKKTQSNIPTIGILSFEHLKQQQQQQPQILEQQQLQNATIGM